MPDWKPPSATIPSGAMGITDYLENGGDINIAKRGRALQHQDHGALRPARR
jgi:hypothetical protein